MIPKTIHYIWFGGKELPDMAKKCIKSWQKYCPDYEIKKWDETNFDINSNLYCSEAYKNKKYAFCSDYARLWILYNYGGIYMDTDVEVLKNLDEFLINKAFSGFESETRIPTGIMASEKGLPIFKEFLDYYTVRDFVKEDGSLDMTTNVEIITNTCLKYGLEQNNTKQTINDMVFYPNDYFCPKEWDTKKTTLTNNSATIHHFDGSWVPEEIKIYFLYKRYREKYGIFGKFLFVLFHPLLALKLKKGSKK